MNDRVTLLLEGNSSSRDWAAISERRNIVRVPNFAMLEEALDSGPRPSESEFAAVVLDRSVTAAQFLEILSSLPTDFRSDVFAFNDDGTGFLSAVTPNEGRVLCRLSSEEIDFHMTVRFGARTRTAAHPSLHAESCN